MPLSNHTSISLFSACTACTISDRAEMEERAPSNWRPPWFETTSASAPLRAAIMASSGSMIPLIINLPPHISLMRATSSQLKRGSNCSSVQAVREDKSSTPFAWPTILPKLWRLVPSIFIHHCGLVIKLTILASVGLGGADKPFLMSLWRCPSTCKSAVRINAEQLASFARWIKLAT